MTTRRDFMQQAAGAAAGVLFTSCGLLEAAHAQGTGKRKQAMVAGKRVRTVDVHAHCVIPEALALMGQKLDGPTKGTQLQAIVLADRLRAMDEQGIDVEALSINPSWYALERDLVTKVIQLQNEKLAELCASKPDRFVAYATLALQYPDLAVQQLEDGMKKYGLRGAAIGSNVMGQDFSDPKFHPVWAKAEELGALLFIHPQAAPEIANRLKGNGWLNNTIGLPLDTTIALSHLIYEGTLDKYPRLKVCSAHGGGYLPSYAPRSDHSCFVSPAGCDPNIVLKKKPTEYLKQLYFDSLIFTPEALRHLAAQVGASQIVLGTDYPFPWQDKAVEHVMQTPGFTDAQRAAILGGTAAKLLGIQ